MSWGCFQDHTSPRINILISFLVHKRPDKMRDTDPPMVDLSQSSQVKSRQQEERLVQKWSRKSEPYSYPKAVQDLYDKLLGGWAKRNMADLLIPRPYLRHRLIYPTLW